MSVTNLVTNLSLCLVITKFGDKFVTEFVTKFVTKKVWSPIWLETLKHQLPVRQVAARGNCQTDDSCNNGGGDPNSHLLLNLDNNVDLKLRLICLAKVCDTLPGKKNI